MHRPQPSVSPPTTPPSRNLHTPKKLLKTPKSTAHDYTLEHSSQYTITATIVVIIHRFEHSPNPPKTLAARSREHELGAPISQFRIQRSPISGSDGDVDPPPHASAPRGLHFHRLLSIPCRICEVSHGTQIGNVCQTIQLKASGE